MIRIIITTCTVLATLLTTAQTAQKIGGNPLNLDKSAVMEIESSTRGFLPPRMTTAQRTAIGSPAIGLVVYNTDAKKLEVWDGTNWSGGGGNDNLGDHIAIKDLNMGSKNITNADKISTTSAQISKGTDGVAPTTGQVATAADVNGNIIWKSPEPFPDTNIHVIKPTGNKYYLRNDQDYLILVSNGTTVMMHPSIVSPVVSGKRITIKNIGSTTAKFHPAFQEVYTINDISYYNSASSDYSWFEIPPNTTYNFVSVSRNQWYTF